MCIRYRIAAIEEDKIRTILILPERASFPKIDTLIDNNITRKIIGKKDSIKLGVLFSFILNKLIIFIKKNWKSNLNKTIIVIKY